MQESDASSFSLHDRLLFIRHSRDLRLTQGWCREGKEIPSWRVDIHPERRLSLSLQCAGYSSRQSPTAHLCVARGLVPELHAYHSPPCLLNFNSMVPTLFSIFPLPQSARANKTFTYLIVIRAAMFPIPNLKRLSYY